ncbi:MAG: RNHCP domain-containing protein [Candidatus Gracilibacteria bacterium]|nr:RNHCP domain-containing protein [Candidatus Gracilibacteria bacterium]
MGFIMRNEQFKCIFCHSQVLPHPDGSARNHCPKCLYSKHLDKNFPGDRLSTCESLMKPVGIDYKKNKDYMIKHRCLKCGKEILNKVASDDDFLDFVKKLNKSL